nr:MAG TPA: hypothetical protein [Caudoviricetes sp.]
MPFHGGKSHFKFRLSKEMPVSYRHIKEESEENI